MGIRGNMWITDSHNESVRGSCSIQNRDGSVEVLSMTHKISLPADMKTGKPTGNRVHTPVTVMKLIDEATPFLNKACCTGELLPQVRIDLWHISQHGKEENYFTYQLKNVRVVGVSPVISGTEDNFAEDKENIALMYESITWAHHDGNHEYTDTWLVRA